MLSNSYKTMGACQILQNSSFLKDSLDACWILDPPKVVYFGGSVTVTTIFFESPSNGDVPSCIRRVSLVKVVFFFPI